MEACVARQPIFDRHRQVYAYELLFRQGLTQALDTFDGDRATSVVLTHSFSLIGLETLTGGKRAFVNFTRPLLLAEVAMAFPVQLVVVEILEDVEPDAPLLQACQRLKRAGYKLVLDDFVYQPRYQPLVDLADIIKVDFLTTSIPQRAWLPKALRTPHLKFLAEKVETQADWQMALDCGYDYVQGFFFSKPELISAQDVPVYKRNALEILAELSQPQVNFDGLEQLILREVSFAYKLLRFVNSAYFNLRHRVRSVRHALMLLGAEELRKWASLVVLSGMGADKPAELAVLAALRGKFCELIGVHSGQAHRRADLYLMGLFSLLDAFTDRPLDDVLGQLPLPLDVRHALQGEDGPFTWIYRLVLAYEAADWAAVSRLAAQLHLSEQAVPPCYQQAVRWASHIFSTDTQRTNPGRSNGNGPQRP